MGKGTKIWLIAAAFLVLGGCILFGGMMMKLGWDFGKLDTQNYETTAHRVEEAFHSISIESDTAQIDLQLSADNRCEVLCYEGQNTNHSVAVHNGTLTVVLQDERKWYDHIGFSTKSPKLTLLLPQAQYDSLVIREDTGDIEIPQDFSFGSVDIAVSTAYVKNCASATGSIKIKTTTGKIRLENVQAKMLSLSVTTGSIAATGITCSEDMTLQVTTGSTRLTDVHCKNLISSGNTGDISLKNVVATDKFSIERSTGDVHFEGADAAEITVKTDTGDVTGTLLTEKIFITATDTGRLRVPNSTTGGKCEITTDTGNILIEIKNSFI